MRPPGITFTHMFSCTLLDGNSQNKRRNFMYVYSEQRPFKCDSCDKSFCKKTDLARHIKLHSADKPHVCDTCDKAFRHKYDLNRHYKVHTGEKSYSCDMCKRAYCQKKSLIEHMKAHTGEKSNKSDSCDKSFSDNNSLLEYSQTDGMLLLFRMLVLFRENDVGFICKMGEINFSI